MWSEMTIGLILIGMHYLIYKITNRLDNKIYVGKHKTEDKNDDYFGSGLLLGRAVEKHGKEHFTKEILMECQSEEEMNQRELDIVDEDFVSRDDTYNIKLGGQGGFDYINENKLNLTETAKRRHKENSRPVLGGIATQKLFREDIQFREEMRAKLSFSAHRWQSIMGHGAFSGKHHSDESIEKMRKSKIGKFDGSKNPSFGKHWITDGVISKLVPKNDPIPQNFKTGRV